jgi:archaellum component FlaC
VKPRLTISPKTTVTPGETIDITGAGFPASATIDLSVSSYTVGYAETDQYGDFENIVSWTVADMPKGTYNLSAIYEGETIASTPVNIICGLYYWDYQAGTWVSLYTISGTVTRDMEEGTLPLTIWGRGFESDVYVYNITIRNILYDYSQIIYNGTPPVTTDMGGSFMVDLTLGPTPGGTYDVTATTLETYTFKGSVTINPYIEAYDYLKYTGMFNTTRYTSLAAASTDLKRTTASAEVIVFAWAFAPGNVTIAGTATTVPAEIFLDSETNTLGIAEVVNGTKIGDHTFLPNDSGFSVVCVLMPSEVTRGGHEIGQVQSTTVPSLRFSARTNIWVGPTAFFWPPQGTVGPYTTIPYTFEGVGVVSGSIVGPFACLDSGHRTCHGNITYNPNDYEEVSKGLGTTVTVWGSGFDPDMDVYVFVEGINPVDLTALYTSYFATYGSTLTSLVPDGILVANTTTDGKGEFNVKFIMPTLPGASYRIKVMVRTVAGGFDEVEGMAVSAPPPAAWSFVGGNFTVLPGLILNPAIAVGPYVAEVVSTGNPYGTAGAIKGVAFRTTNFDALSNGQYRQDFTDGIMGVNLQVANWRLTANGTLMSILSPFVYPGLFIPSLETGVYEVALILPDGKLTKPTHIGIINDVVLITQIYDNTVEILTNTGRILTSLDSLHAKIDSINGTVATIKTDVGTIKTDVASIKAKVMEIKDGIAVIQTSLGEVKTSLSSINAKLVSLDETVATISTAVGEIKTGVDSIGLKVQDINGTVATIKTDVGTISGKVTSIDGNVATIKTDVGTVKTDISAVKSSVGDVEDSVKTVSGTISGLIWPIWVAVILSLIAAIAAIYVVVTIHRKIAG